MASHYNLYPIEDLYSDSVDRVAVRRVIVRMELTPESHFDMGRWLDLPAYVKVGSQLTCGEVLSHCGSTACIAGFTVAELDADCPAGIFSSFGGRESIYDRARSHLGLTKNQAINLFTYRVVSKSRAIQVLEHLAETGYVDWTIPDRESVIV